MRKTIFCVGTLILCLIVLSGCGKLERKGTAHENIPPSVYFSNIPAEGTYFSVNPVVYWFGTDMDGFVAAYQYVVIVEDSVLSMGGVDEVQSFLADIPPDSVSWADQNALRGILAVHLGSFRGHQDTVTFFASMDPDIYTPQYIFLRALDNDGAISEVIYRMYYRNNHRPEAFIEVSEDFTELAHYCLEETTLTWNGISIAWSGLDIADYPDSRKQPAFMFKWDLVGPFAVEPTPEIIDTNKVFLYSLDSIQVAGQWIESRWVSETQHVFTDLENYPDSGFGWYQLRLWAQDDAFVSNEVAATLNFRIIKPAFRYSDRSRRTILLVDATVYGGVRGGPKDDTASAPVRPFYRETLDALTQKGLCDEWMLWYDPISEPGSDSKAAPDRDLISRYDLVIVVNVGSKSALTGATLNDFEDYMDIGGRVWFIGMNNYNIDTGNEAKGLSDFWNEYLGLEVAVAPTWTMLDTTTLQFIQAKPFGLWTDLPTLKADTALCHQLLGYSDTSSVTNFGVRGIPFVGYEGISNLQDWEGRIPYERRIYSFVSFFGTLSLLHNNPCGVNYIGSTFRSAEFTFPLNLMKNDAPDYPASSVMEKMVEWFWDDLP